MTDNRTTEQRCDDAREAVNLPPIDRDWYYRWGRRLDCEECPANVACDHYAFMTQIEQDVDALRRTDV